MYICIYIYIHYIHYTHYIYIYIYITYTPYYKYIYIYIIPYIYIYICIYNDIHRAVCAADHEGDARAARLEAREEQLREPLLL